MKKKFLAIGATSVLLFLGSFIGFNAYAQNQNVTTVNSSCSFQNLNNCSRDDLVSLLIQLILQILNKSNDSVTPQQLPDLIVEDIYYSDNSLKVKFCNIGKGVGSENFRIKLRNEITGQEFTSINRIRLNIPKPGTCAIVEDFSPAVIGLLYGEGAKVSATIDWENRVSESNKTNNRLEKVLPSLNATAQRIISPVSGTTLCEGTSTDILWKGKENTLYTIYIEAKSDNKVWELPFGDVTTDKNGIASYRWLRVGEIANSGFLDKVSNDCYKIYIMPKASDNINEILSVENITISKCTEDSSNKMILSPQSGSAFLVGDSVDIIWKGEKNTLYIASVETMDKSQNWTLAFSDTITNEHGIGMHTWQRVAENFADGNQYRIYVKPQASTNTRDIISVENITFTKQVTGEPELSITFPTENDILVIGETYTITWSSKNLKGNSISILDNNETLIATLPITATSYKWTVPETYRGEQSEITIISEIGTNWEKVAKTKFIASKYSQGDLRYPAAEIIEDNLPSDLTFWVPASCPSIPSIMNYEVPEGYELVFCETGASGYYGERFYNTISKVKIRAKSYTEFNATEIVEDNLPYNITFWTEAHCPSLNGYGYKIPEGYELVSCEGGNVGSHGGCASCSMSKIKLKSKAEYAKFNATEIVEDNLPFSITLWAEQYCPGSDTTIGYETPEGYKVVACEGGEKGTHGGCTYCPMSKFKLEKVSDGN